MKELAKPLFALVFSTLLWSDAFSSIEPRVLGTYHSGFFDESAAEITAYDENSKRLFVVNAQAAAVDILSVENPTVPVKVGSLDVQAYGGVANSVDVFENTVAVAIESNTKTDPGKVVLYSTDGEHLKTVVVGALPDMLCFTPDGSRVVVANEGEPNDDYSIDPEGSISVIDLSLGVDNATVEHITFEQYVGKEDSLIAQGVRIFGPGANAAQDFEPEYIAVAPDGKRAYVTLQENNAIAVIDLETNTVSELLALGYKDHSIEGNGLDASNKDNAINITTWPVRGLYLPDAIAAMQMDGETYLLTANEGDARDYDTYCEEDRFKDVKLDPSVFPNWEALQQSENLGRIKITKALADTNSSGEFRTVYTFGARSFSIWKTDGSLVWDSGDEFEQILAQENPDFFNASNDEQSFDDRSDDKGPEPEGVTIGYIDGVPYAFVGLERVGGFMVYDVSEPRNARFVAYMNNRDFTVPIDDGVDIETLKSIGDLGAEGLCFVKTESSPGATPMLVVSNEVSGSVSLFDLTPSPLAEYPGLSVSNAQEIIHTSASGVNVLCAMHGAVLYGVGPERA